MVAFNGDQQQSIIMISSRKSYVIWTRITVRYRFVVVVLTGAIVICSNGTHYTNLSLNMLSFSIWSILYSTNCVLTGLYFSCLIIFVFLFRKQKDQEKEKRKGLQYSLAHIQNLYKIVTFTNLFSFCSY